MNPQAQGVVRAAQVWLQSSWHVQVPFPWLQACVDWLQEEGAGRPMSQSQLNQQVLDQWLQTDLRDLAHPVLPAGLSEAQKTELRGSFCVQVDSLLDVSQPAYGQLQRWKGSDCTNEGVSADTQATQRPWEAKPTRMLLLQLTDGVQSLEGMEYQPIPGLSASIRPGAKLQLQGQMACRLGVLLLGPGNVKVLGGEVEELAERNSQGKVLCRALGLPEEEPPQGDVAPPPPGNAPEDNELDDQELLAVLQAQEAGQEGRLERDSGYGTRSETSSSSSGSQSTQNSISSSRNLQNSSSSSSSRNLSIQNSSSSSSSRNLSIQNSSSSSSSSRNLSIQNSSSSSTRSLVHQSHASGRRWENSPARPRVPEPGSPDHFPDEDFDDLPLDELDGAMFQERPAAGQAPSPTNNPRGMSPDFDTFDESNDFLDERDDFPDEDMDCLAPAEPEGPRERPPPVVETPLSFNAQQDSGPRTQGSSSLTSRNLAVVKSEPLDQRSFTTTVKTEPEDRSSVFSTTIKTGPEDGASLTLDSPPFTYLSLLQNRSQSQAPPCKVRVKAFIVTLQGNLQSTGGVWRVGAAISDGTGFLDVVLSDPVLTSLLGFSVAQKTAMKRDPSRRAEMAAGMKACQQGLVDMCCVMTLTFGLDGDVPVVVQTEDVTDEDCLALEERVTTRRGH